MDPQGEPQDKAMAPTLEELPQMDGLCDACEPDEAQQATQVCRICSFAFCPVHAQNHSSRTLHCLSPYDHETAQENVANRQAVGGAEGSVVGLDGDQETSPHVEVDDDAGALRASRQEEEMECQGAAAAGDAPKRDTVTVERLRCKEHGQEGSLYCREDEKIICVLCAVQGEHQEHKIITLHEAYTWQKSRQGNELLNYAQGMSDKIKTKWTNPEMSVEELEAYVDSQFNELHRLVRLEEKRTLHLVDLKEAFLTASAAEKIAEINVETERLQEEMANITNQLCILEEAEGGSPAVIAKALVAAPGPAHRVQRDVEARPRLPEPRANPVDPRDLEDDDFRPSMDHAP